MVDEVRVHSGQALVVVHVLGEVGLFWILLKEGVSRGHGLL